jgi:hypothetical protein
VEYDVRDPAIDIHGDVFVGVVTDHVAVREPVP